MNVTKPSDMTEKEVQNYVDYLEKKYGKKVDELTIEVDAEDPFRDPSGAEEQGHSMKNQFAHEIQL